jgi:hypothetical protein
LIWYVVCKGESEREAEGSTSHLYQSICTTSHATGSSHPCRHNGHGGPLESLNVRLTLPLASKGRAHTHRSLRGEARKSRSADDVVVCSWEVYVPRHTAGMSSHFLLQCKPVFRDMRDAQTVQDGVPQWHTLAMNSSHVGTRTRRAIDCVQYSTYVRSSISSAAGVLLTAHSVADLPINTYLLLRVRCASQKLLYSLHVHRKKTKHSQGGGKSSPVPLHQAGAIASTVTASSLPQSVQDVTSILYNSV